MSNKLGAIQSLYFVSKVDGDSLVKIAAGIIQISGVVFVFLAQHRQLTIQFDGQGIRRRVCFGKTCWKCTDLTKVNSNSAGYELCFSDGARIRILRSLVSNNTKLAEFLKSKEPTSK